MTGAAEVEDAYPWMDLARLLAAFAVCIGHVRNLLLVDYQPNLGWGAKAFYFLTGLGGAAVSLFFVLSGFWIARVVDRKGASDTFVRGYLIDRFARLYVVAVPAIALTAALDLAAIRVFDSAIHQGGLVPNLLPHPVAESLGLVTLLGNLAFLQAIVVPAFGSNGPLWSLAFEFWYYLVFPAIWLAVRHRRATWLLPCLAILALDRQLTLGFLIWLGGAAVYLLQAHCGRRPGLIVARAALAASLCAFAASLARNRLQAIGLIDPALTLSFAATLYFLLNARLPMPRALMPLARYGARSSFSLYAIHMPIAALVAGALVRGSRWPATAPNIALVVGISFCLVWAGHAFSRLTEARTPAVRAWLHARLRRPAATAARA